jgi:putative membrane protein
VSIADLAHVNGALNFTLSILLTTGWLLIKRKRIRQHRRVMIAAVIVSALFLTSYITYHANIGSKPFPGTGLMRVIYFAILIPHVLLAALTLPFILVTFVRGLRRNDEKHRRLARKTMPVWLFVSVSGVVVYLMLYHLY